MICPFSISIEICRQKIWEKENFENRKHDEQLDEDNLPESSTDNHRPEPVIVQIKSIPKHHFTALSTCRNQHSYVTNKVMFTLNIEDSQE